MFASHSWGVYENPTLQNHESASILLTINDFCFSQMAVILDFTHYAISKVLSNHTTMSGMHENPMVGTKNMLLRIF